MLSGALAFANSCARDRISHHQVAIFGKLHQRWELELNQESVKP